MEGLHHDTNIEPTPSVKGDESTVNIDIPADTESPKIAPSSEIEQNFASAPINQDLSSDDKINLYAQMVRIRRFEERSLRAYQQGHIGGFLHLYIGQEAVAVGSVSVLGNDDHVITAYRDHGHALAVGMNMDECMAELYRKNRLL